MSDFDAAGMEERIDAIRLKPLRLNIPARIVQPSPPSLPQITPTEVTMSNLREAWLWVLQSG